MVRVTDENDNSPKFIGNGKPIVAVIPNTANFGFPVTRVEATDDDIGLNAEIRYSLLNEPTKLFEIDEMTGSIRVIGPITNDQRVYGFDVKATDRKGAEDGRSAIVNVFVSYKMYLIHIFILKMNHLLTQKQNSYHTCDPFSIFCTIHNISLLFIRRSTFWMIAAMCDWS